ncbi:uncharacterized protein LOC9630089 [Selaginella moellendorffii]|nr:uncharacterized protein LOC9630089 [Selaginella moellendorffii]|eukprot:XP_002961469.2 uncharacterized protein LOC9630089 [Selaginella moellendorffii]
MDFLSLALVLLALIHGQAMDLSIGTGGNDTMTAQDLLERNGFPGGLLPSNVEGYTLDNSGRFVLKLDAKCDVTIPDAYPVEYRAKIEGLLSYGSIKDLSGVYVKVFLVWWELTGIYMENEKVVFQVGILSASYPASNFDESPDCGSKASSSSTTLDRSTH